MALSNKQKKSVEVQEAVEVQETVKAQETVSDEKETVFIYVGPNSRAISRFTVFRNGYPPQLKEDLEKFPLLKNLFIDPKDLPVFLKNVDTPGTVEHTWFNEVKKYFAGAVSN